MPVSVTKTQAAPGDQIPGGNVDIHDGPAQGAGRYRHQEVHQVLRKAPGLPIETNIHAHHECPGHIWKALFEWWGRRTGESLTYDCRTTLLGRRSQGDDGESWGGICFDHLDEPFAIVHGRALQAIRKDREKEREKKPDTPSSTATQVTDEIKRKVQRDLVERFRWANELEEWHRARQDLSKAKRGSEAPKPFEGPRSRREFIRMWVESGLATIQKGPRGDKVLLKW